MAPNLQRIRSPTFPSLSHTHKKNTLQYTHTHKSTNTHKQYPPPPHQYLQYLFLLYKMHIYTQSHSLSNVCTHTFALFLPLSLSLTHTLTYYNTLTISLFLSLSFCLKHSHSWIHGVPRQEKQITVFSTWKACKATKVKSKQKRIFSSSPIVRTSPFPPPSPILRQSRKLKFNGPFLIRHGLLCGLSYLF